jgi:hypothetical protein
MAFFFNSSRTIALKDANDFVLLLLLIGMDLTASPILMREVGEAIDLVCHGISPHDSISIDVVSLSCPIFDVFSS